MEAEGRRMELQAQGKRTTITRNGYSLSPGGPTQPQAMVFLRMPPGLASRLPQTPPPAFTSSQGNYDSPYLFQNKMYTPQIRRT